MESGTATLAPSLTLTPSLIPVDTKPPSTKTPEAPTATTTATPTPARTWTPYATATLEYAPLILTQAAANLDEINMIVNRRVIADCLNIRELPDTRAPIVQCLKAGQSVELTGATYRGALFEWVQVWLHVETDTVYCNTLAPESCPWMAATLLSDGRAYLLPIGG